MVDEDDEDDVRGMQDVDDDDNDGDIEAGIGVVDSSGGDDDRPSTSRRCQRWVSTRAVSCASGSAPWWPPSRARVSTPSKRTMSDSERAVECGLMGMKSMQECRIR